MNATSTPTLTDRQRELLSTIRRLTAARGGIPPTLKETGEAMRCHLTNVRMLARKCKRAGALDYRPRTARSWVVIDEKRCSR